MTSRDLAAVLAEKERDVEAARLRVEKLRVRLAASERTRQTLRDVLGEGDDGLPLARAPLYAALIGAIAANASLFLGFAVVISRLDESVWIGSFLLAAIVGLATLPISGRPGAGGLARIGVRRVSMVLLGIAVLGVLGGWWYRFG